MTRTVFHLRNILILVGVIITSVGLIYFAGEFIERLSDWGRVASLALLAVMFVSLGRHFEVSGEGTELVDRKGWRWLRVTTALYLLGMLSTLAGVIVFFGIDDVDRLVKAAVAIFGGLAIILVTARQLQPEAE